MTCLDLLTLNTWTPSQVPFKEREVKLFGMSFPAGRG